MRRRSFIERSALLAAGFGLTSPAVMGARLWFGKDKVRVGVIGTGDRGTGLIRLMQDIEGLDVAACSDLIPFRLEDAIGLAKGAKAYENYQDLLADSKIDAIIISTPFSTHDEIALDALRAGKHVFCEKTMTKGIERIQEVVSSAYGSDLIFQTGHQWHSSPLYKKARKIIQNGYLGDVTSIECQWNRNGDWRRPVPDPKWEKMINWRMYREFSGGLVAELMSHQIDWINWVKGSRPSRIVGFGGIDHWKDGRETFDNAHVMFEYPDGMEATFTCTTTNGYEDFGIKVLGEQATMKLDYTTGSILAEDRSLKDKGLVDGVSGATLKAWQDGNWSPIKAPGNDPTIDALKEFYNSIVNGAKVTSDVRTGAVTSKCVHISLDSLHNGGVKYWDDYQEIKFA